MSPASTDPPRRHPWTRTGSRKNLTVAALTGLALTLTACASASDAMGGSASTADGTRSTAGTSSETGVLTVLAAASLTDVFEEIAADFEADHPGVTVEQSFAASSTIVAQVNEGAPADVIALAGQKSLEPLEETYRTTDPIVFTTNTLELAVPLDNPAAIVGLEDLPRDGIRLVVCEVAVPCGTATATLFLDHGIEPAIASFEPDVRATLTKVELGEADVGIVYRTDVVAAGDKVVGIQIPLPDNVINSYPLLSVSDSPLAQEFIDEVMSARGQRHLTDAGFVAP